ncbi:phosphatidylethanolamine-binding protein [Scheffersomyces amazonensis]|uniref:phosphatidylethanolamine-binding protein n=1 Tax=Scheffersomyces amazonensis TaxID=1078765 RepID=UPI00315D4EC6
MEYIERALGYLFFNFKVGDSGILTKTLKFSTSNPQFKVTSSSFSDNGYLPLESAQVGVGGKNLSPPLTIEFIGERDPQIKSLVLVCHDVDVPIWFAVTHVIVYNIPVDGDKPIEFEFGAFNGERAKSTDKDSYIVGKGTTGERSFIGPRPILGHGDHRYVFQVIAINDIATNLLNELSSDEVNPTKLTEILKDNAISYATITGLYKRD